MTSLRRPLTLCCAAAAAAALHAPGAHANPYELFGFTPRAVGLAMSNVALSDDLAASFYNPAGMLGHTKTEIGIGIDYSAMSLYVDRAYVGQVAGYNLQNGYNDDAPRAELALIFPLGGAILRDRVVLGLNLGLPFTGFVRVQTVDQARPQFYMYQSKPQRFASSASIGVRITDGFSVGVGLEMNARQVGNVSFSVDLASKQFTAREINIGMDIIPEPIAGLLIEPTDWLKIGFSYRKETQLYYAQPTDINLGALGDLQLNVHGYAQYWPHVFSLGVAARPNAEWLITLQADYLLWNRSPNDQAYVSLSPTGTIFSGLGLNSVLTIGSNDATLGFVNIIIPKVGAEWSPSEWLTVRGGVSFRPPVTPDQIGTTNYLDNFTETVAGGVTMKFIDPLKVFTDPVAFDLGAQVIIANPRTQNKANTGDVTGGATFGGTVVTLGAMLRYQY
jgi:long-subunit fatty acid transport protein